MEMKKFQSVSKGNYGFELDRRCPNKKDVIRKAIKHYSSVVQ